MKKFPQTQLRKRVRHQGGDTGAKLMFFDSNLCLVAHTKSCEPYLAVHTADAKGADIRYIFSPEMPQEWVSNLRDLAYSALMGAAVYQPYRYMIITAIYWALLCRCTAAPALRSAARRAQKTFS